MIGAKVENQPMKQMNKIKIFRFICHNTDVTKQSIAYHLGMSMPTVLQNIKALVADGLVEEQKTLASTGGRRARTVSVVRDARFAVGVEITARHLETALLDLGGFITASERVSLAYQDSPEYYRAFGEHIASFIQKQAIPTDRLLGVGISLPGNVDTARDLITQSRVLRIANVSLQKFRRHLPYETIFCNDANAAGLAEQKYIQKDAVFLSLAETVGGAVFFDRQLYMGGQYKSGEIGHMILVPDGKECYCGKSGCMDAYCSSRVLSSLAEGSLERFFQKLSQGDPACTAGWETYLRYLAISVTNLRMAFDCPIILGGYVGAYLSPYLSRFQELASLYNTFDRDSDYLSVCHAPDHAYALGAGLQFIEGFYDSIP